MIWPVSKSYSKHVPLDGEPGSFWEQRGDRFHCGVDIYAPFGSDVSAMEDGIILDIGVFTSSSLVDYWYETCYIVVAHASGIVVRYAEMDQCVFENDDFVFKGMLLGHVGQVINESKVTAKSPYYVRRLKKTNELSMLHIETFSSYPVDIPKYMGGNTFQNIKPSFLNNPGDILEDAAISSLDLEKHSKKSV